MVFNKGGLKEVFPKFVQGDYYNYLVAESKWKSSVRSWKGFENFCKVLQKNNITFVQVGNKREVLVEGRYYANSTQKSLREKGKKEFKYFYTRGNLEKYLIRVFSRPQDK